MTLIRLLLLPLLLTLAGCESFRWGADPERSEVLARSASSAATMNEPGAAGAPASALRPRAAMTPIDMALADPGRLAGDRSLDERRQTARLLRFFRIGPDMVVADLFSGGGYWSEAVSLVVGPRGRVLAHNSPASLERAGADLEGRYAGGRLRNVERLVAGNEELRLPAESFDVVLLLNAYHDAYHADRAAPWAPLDGPALLARIHAALKPGGVLGVVDHVADPAMPAAEAAFLGRIDPARLQADIETAGFVLESRSDMLRNPTDDRRVSVFEPGVGESADRVVLRFRKPAGP
jgi:predicted methyltransferase